MAGNLEWLFKISLVSETPKIPIKREEVCARSNLSKQNKFVVEKSQISRYFQLLYLSVLYFSARHCWVVHCSGHAYYSHPLINTLLVVFITIIALICNSRRIAYLALVIYVGVAYGIADSLLIDHNATSRWVSWGIFQIHDAGDFLDRAAQF